MIKKPFYRKEVFRHFSENLKCSAKMTVRMSVTEHLRFTQLLREFYKEDFKESLNKSDMQISEMIF